MPVYTSDCKGVLFAHELVDTLLPFSGKVTIGEVVAVEALMGSAVGTAKTARGRRGKRPICTLLEARPIAALTELL